MLKKEKKPILLMLYAPCEKINNSFSIINKFFRGCGVCKMMKPAYAEAATELKDKAVGG